MQNSIKINASEILSNALEKHKIRLELLVAETSIWAHPDEHHRLLAKGNAAVSSLAISTGNSYGHVFDISNSGTITIRKSLAPIIKKFIWKI